jgi:Spy/CpxP family protein refolding chaperone
MKRSPWIGGAMAALLLLCAVGAALAQQGNFDPERMVGRQLEMMKDRLKLTADQEKKLKPILIDSMKQQMEMRKKYQIEPGQPPSEEARTAMAKAREENNKKIAEVLDKDQMTEYQKMMQERMGRGGQGGPGGRKKQQ